TAGGGMQHGRIDFQEAQVVQVLPDILQDANPLDGLVAQLGVVNQIEIPVPERKFDVFDAPPLVRMRQQRLAEVVQLVGKNRKFAGLGSPEPAFDAKLVAKVEKLGQSPGRVPDLFLSDHHLNSPGAIAKIKEANFAHFSHAQDPT